MSWQAYVDSSLLGTGKVQSAAIYGHDNTPWASTPNLSGTFNPSPLINGFTDPNELRSEGLHIGDTRYVIIKSDERSIYGRAKDSSGFVAVKTSKTVIVGMYDGGQVAGEAAKVVEGLADYLIGAGY